MRRISAKYYLAGFVSIITFLVYLPTLQNKFVEWDDSRFIYENLNIRSLNATFFKWAFLDLSAPGSDYWRPLSYLSHALDYATWELNPLGHHLTNNILHAINTFLVVLLVVRLMEAVGAVIPACPESIRGSGEAPPRSKKGRSTESPLQKVAGMTNQFSSSRDTKSIIIVAATTGLLFGLHPIHVESVAWVSERKDLLCALFFLLSILAYLKYASCNFLSFPLVTDTSSKKDPGQAGMTKPGRRFFSKHYALSLLFFTLALMSKPMAVSLPVVLLILDWYPFQRIQSLKTFRKAVIEKLPFIALALALSILTVLAQKTVGAMDMMEYLPLSARLLVAAKSLVAYLCNMALPLDLSPYYPYPVIISLFSPEFFPAVMLVSGITVLCLFLIRRQKAWTVLWGYYVATLVPVLGIVQVGGQAMADRYTYLPSISPFLMTGVVIAWLFRRLSKPDRRARILTQCGLAAALLLIFGISYLTITQISIWKDSVSLWSFVIEREPGRVPLAYNNRGVALIDEGRFHEAIEDFNKAISLQPAYYEAYGNRGTAFDKIGQLDNALADMDKAVSLSSFYKTYYARGMLFEKKGEVEKALMDYKQAIALNPLYSEAYIRLGLLYNKTGSFKKAIESFNGALAIDPDHVDAHYDLGKALADSGDLVGALDHFRTAVRLRPDNALYRNILGITYGQKGLLEDAVQQFNEAVRIDPSESAYRKNLERALKLKESAPEKNNKDGAD